MIRKLNSLYEIKVIREFKLWIFPINISTGDGAFKARGNLAHFSLFLSGVILELLFTEY